MPSVPELLKATREARKLSIQEAAEITKIKSDHIRALEQGDFHVFSAPIFIRGFVRTYARFLKLDSEQIIQNLEIELAPGGLLKDHSQSSSRHTGPLDFIMYYLSQVKWGIVGPLIAGGTLLLGLIFGTRAWMDYRSRDPLAGLQPGVYQPSNTKHAEILPVPPLKK